ncbi:GOLPH3/VPS74 family protein [Actinomadura flavalba]|uniref:GOLPH3/VPS74 family protein n=1 Tax=Actinomadura flavalba TaxID=1120938 RepID=UPI0003AAEC65|nr:GPP34 family phosphoprotein [Actinomadura flavalba]
MTTLTLAEEFLLLVLKDETGKPMVDGQKTAAGLAGAAVVELTMDGALRLSGEGEPGVKKGRLIVTGGTPRDRRLASLLEVVDGRKPKDAVSKVSGVSAWRNRSKDLKEALLQDLAEQGLLVEEKGKALGLFPTTAWKQGDPGVEQEIVQRVRAAVVDGAEPDPRTAALIALLFAVDVLKKLYPDADRKALKRRAKEISEAEWGGEAVRKAVQEVQAATMTAVVAVTTTTSSS